MDQINMASFALFLLVAAWQDLKRRMIDLWVYWLFGILALLLRLWGMAGGGMGERWGGWAAAGAGMLVGLGLLAAGWASRGAIGDGDGWFFVISGIYLGFWNNLGLLFYSLLLCGLYSLCILVKGAIKGRSLGKSRVPFLPFLIPAILWMVVS